MADERDTELDCLDETILDVPGKAMPIMFACNSYTNGSFQGWFDQVNIDKFEVVLDGPRMVITDIGAGRVTIGRKTFRHRGWSSWVGNWCWDELWIVNYKDLLRYLKARRYTCSQGPEPLYRWFNAPGSPAA